MVRGCAITLGLAALVLCAAPGLGDVKVWNNAAGGPWSTASNWTGGLPGPGDDADLTLSGTFVVTLEGARSVNSVTVGAGKTLRLRGSTPGGLASLTVASGIDNGGRIELTEVQDAWGAEIIINGGALLNQAGATIATLAGIGGERRIRGPVTNDGTLDFRGANTLLWPLVATQPITNTGTIQLQSPNSLAFFGGNFTQGGALTGSGSIQFFGSTVNLSQPFTNAAITLLTFTSVYNGPAALTNANSLTMNSSTFNATLTNSPGATLITAAGTPRINSSFTNPVGATVRVQGSGNTTLTFGAEPTNLGTFELSELAQPFSITLNVSSGAFRNMPGGLLHVQTGLGGTRTLGLALSNAGTLRIDRTCTLSRSGAAHTSSGVIDVLGGDLLVPQTGVGASFTTDGELDVALGRQMRLTGGSFFVAGGSMPGNGTLFLDSALVGVSMDHTIFTTAWEVVHSNITGAGTLTNAGRLTLDGSTCAKTLVNAAGGTLLVPAGASSIDSAFSQQSGSLLRIVGGATAAELTCSGGFSNAGAVELTDSAAPGGAALHVTLGDLTNAADGEISTLPGAAGGERLLDGRLANAGLLRTEADTRLEQDQSGDAQSSGELEVTAGALQLEFLAAGSPAPRFVTSGAVLLRSGTTFELVNSAYAQTAGQTVLEGATLAAESAVEVLGGSLRGSGDVLADLANAGTIAPGSSAGALSVTGDFSQSVDGTLAIELGGLSPGTEHDVLLVSGAATLDGTVSPSILPAFTPANGDEFEIMTFASRSGTLDLPGGCGAGGASFALTHGSTSVTLTYSTARVGDVNCDCAITFDDIDPFIVALVGQEAYETNYPTCNFLLADANLDGSVNFDDIDAFVVLLIGG